MIAFNITLDENNYENVTANQDIYECFSPSSLSTVESLTGRWFLIVLYTLSSLAALLGNLMVIVVGFKGKGSTTTIRKYLINLAVSDIIFGVFCVPFSYSNFMLGQWMLPHWLCPTTQYVQILSIFVTSLTLSLIGVEKYLATLHPFSHIHRWLEDHINLVLLIVWTLGALYGPILFKKQFVSTVILDNNTTVYKCSYNADLTLTRRRLYISSYVILTFLLPLVVIISSYSAIMRKLIKDQNDIDKNAANTIQKTFQQPLPSSKDHKSKIIKMMFTIILMFIICWAPFNIYKILLEYHVLAFCTKFEFYTLVWLYFACHWTSMASSFVNPIVYSFMSPSFRNDLKNICRKGSYKNNNNDDKFTMVKM